ncbi:Rho guanine nucleotide exchange factor 18 [Larimichthys crocea]|uniref:Uncharacterized protein n=1 Tax=Larimichthys crocea TaxID=215358 RepID=A0ACD3RLC4_LARCR|nr:Rho guanine nucleotide exchange factor 18 [Larimichthys crocea]
MLRRETSSSTLPLKTEVPLHLFSTTNQLHKPVGVQQQIPTKLAAFSSNKGKGGKIGKASHRTDSTDQLSPPDSSGSDSQSTSSINTSHPPNVQKPPMPPAQSHPQPSVQPPTIPPHSQSTSSLQFPPHLQPQGPSPNAQAHVQVNVQGLTHSHSMPPPYKVNTEDLNKEDVIFF